MMISFCSFGQNSIEESEFVIENNHLIGNTNFKNELNNLHIIYLCGISILLFTVLFLSINCAKKRKIERNTFRKVIKKQADELKKTLLSKEEKEVLLKEVHHRVKNNLQIINSLIRLQSNFMNKENFSEKLIQTQNRIRSMALIHEKLYRTGNLAKLSVRNYIEELSINILESYQNQNNIQLKFDLETKEYNIDTLIPIGLIINETMSNSLKHAFYERPTGSISIFLHTNGDTAILNIKDDGTGADLSLDELKEDSLGLELIMSLTDQLDGKLDLDTTEGFDYKFTFPNLN